MRNCYTQLYFLYIFHIWLSLYAYKPPYTHTNLNIKLQILTKLTLELIDIIIKNGMTTRLDDELNKPILDQRKQKKTITQKAVRKTFKITAHLANLLPTGTVLTFQILAPIFTHEGKCRTQFSQILTLILLFVCGMSCFVLSFSDSFRDTNGKVCYGMATLSGLWVIDGLAKVPREKASEYKMRFIDVFHGFLSLVVFLAVAGLDKNVVNCFYPKPSEVMEEILWTLPIGVGVICSLLFAAFPTTRHGIGFPLSKK